MFFTLDNTNSERVNKTKFLGVIIDENLNCAKHNVIIMIMLHMRKKYQTHFLMVSGAFHDRNTAIGSLFYF